MLRNSFGNSWGLFIEHNRGNRQTLNPKYLPGKQPIIWGYFLLSWFLLSWCYCRIQRPIILGGSINGALEEGLAGWTLAQLGVDKVAGHDGSQDEPCEVGLPFPALELCVGGWVVTMSVALIFSCRSGTGSF